MTDINVDDFFNDSARTLLILYKVFPRRHAVFVEDVSGPEEPDEFGMHSDRYLACFGALLWLGEEGFLRYENTIATEAIDQALLAGRCFTLLSTPGLLRTDVDASLPESVRAERATRAYALESAVRSRSSSRVRAIMLELLARMSDVQTVNGDSGTG